MNAFALALVAGALAVPQSALAATDRILRADLTIHAPVAEVWKAWTTDTGIATFFAPEGHVDLRVDGQYDVWFNPSGPPGQRGAEGMRIVGVEPMKRFAFTWNAPPTIPAIRAQRTIVVLDLEPLGADQTHLRFTQLGWGEGEEWDKAYAYFDHAWGAVVLPRLVWRFEHGPLDWKSPASAPPLPSMQATLAATTLTNAPSTLAASTPEKSRMTPPPPDIRYVVVFKPGPKWKAGVSFREQPGIMEHVGHFRALLEQGKLEMGGPFLATDRGGMMIPTGGMTEDEVRRYAAADPTVMNGLLTFEVEPWYVGMKKP
jgi:uncharacterized protein YndB with AHSA1/START domain/uncharacterized protein YciI